MVDAPLASGAFESMEVGSGTPVSAVIEWSCCATQRRRTSALMIRG